LDTLDPLEKERLEKVA